MVGTALRSGATDRTERAVLMIVHAYYDEDPRVRREAETLVRDGRPVHVIGLRRPEDDRHGEVDGVRVTRLDVQRHQGAGLATYLREYVSFGLRAAWTGLRAHRRDRYALVQVHSLPDFLVGAALPLRLLGVPVVLDLHEAMPEFFRMRFPRATNPLFVRLLLVQERLSIAVSSATISVNDAMRDRLVDLGVSLDKVTVVPNSPSLARFDPARHPVRPFMADGRLRLVYAGGVTPTYELDVAVGAVAHLAATRPELDPVLDVYGRGDAQAALHALAIAAGIEDRVLFHGRIAIDDVPAAVAASDIGLAPTRLDRFTALTISTKIHEYAAMGKPVVATRLPLVVQTFPAGSVAAYEPGDATSMAAAIVGFVDDPTRRAAAVACTSEIVRTTAWEHEALAYLALVDRLTTGPGGGRLAQATPSRR